MKLFKFIYCWIMWAFVNDCHKYQCDYLLVKNKGWIENDHNHEGHACINTRYHFGKHKTYWNK